MHSIANRWPDAAVFIETPLGLLPYTMEDVSPWAHLMGPSSIWNGMTSVDRDFDLQALMGDEYEMEQQLAEAERAQKAAAAYLHNTTTFEEY